MLKGLFRSSTMHRRMSCAPQEVVLLPRAEHCRSSSEMALAEAGKWYTPRLNSIEEVSLP